MDIIKALIAEFIASFIIVFTFLYLLIAEGTVYEKCFILLLIISILFYATWSLSGSHFLPLSTLSFFFADRMPLHIALLYIIVQVLGMIIAFGAFYVMYEQYLVNMGEEYEVKNNFGSYWVYILYLFSALLICFTYLLCVGNKEIAPVTGFIAGASYAIGFYFIYTNPSILNIHKASHAIIIVALIYLISSFIAGMTYRIILGKPLLHIDIHI